MSGNEKIEILEKAVEMFIGGGFYKTSMDEVAASMRKSKKTIYKHFSSKDELLKESILLFINEARERIETVTGSNENSVRKIYEIGQTASSLLSRISDKWLYDIKTYKPKLWAEVDRLRTEIISNNIIKIILQGQKEELILNKHPEIIVTVMVSSLRNVVNPEFILKNDISTQKAVRITMGIIISGIITEKGRKVYYELLTGN